MKMHNATPGTDGHRGAAAEAAGQVWLTVASSVNYRWGSRTKASTMPPATKKTASDAIAAR